MLSIPNSGKRTSGSSDVTGMGAASVIHQIAIQSAQPATARPSNASDSGRMKKKGQPGQRPGEQRYELPAGAGLGGCGLFSVAAGARFGRLGAVLGFL